jgi:hypothetical protein
MDGEPALVYRLVRIACSTVIWILEARAV